MTPQATQLAEDDDVSTALMNIEYALVAWFGVEMCLKVAAWGIYLYLQDNWNCFDAILSISSIIGVVLEAALDECMSGSNVSSLRAVRGLRLLRTARTLTLLSHSKKLHPVVDTLRQVFPMFVSLTLVIAIFINLFAIVGVEVFGMPTVELASCEPVCSDFSQWLSVILLLFQICVGNSWVSKMYENMNFLLDEGWTHSGAFASSLYFVLFCLIIDVLFINLLGALVIEIYLIEIDKANQARKSNPSIETLFMQKESTQLVSVEDASARYLHAASQSANAPASLPPTQPSSQAHPH